jgi:hypothetical protein
MVAMGKRLLGFLLLVLVAAMPLGCASTKEGPREERSARGVTVGGESGVVVERSDSGTHVKVGGEHGIVVNHPHTEMDDDHDDR